MCGIAVLLMPSSLASRPVLQWIAPRGKLSSESRAAIAKSVVPCTTQASAMRARAARSWAVERRLVQLRKVAQSVPDKVIDTEHGSAMMGCCIQ